MNRRGEKRVGTGQEKSPLFTKTTREMNQQHWRANNRYTYLKNQWERLHIFGKSSFLDREPSTMIQTLLNFSPRLMFGEFPMVYKKMSALIWLRAYNHDFELVTTL